jgi:hypothetical protein
LYQKYKKDTSVISPSTLSKHISELEFSIPDGAPIHLKTEPYSIPIENSFSNHGRTKKQLLLTNPQKTIELLQKLDNKFDELYKKDYIISSDTS